MVIIKIMAVLVNPGGRLVEVDDPKQIEYWLGQGFRNATTQETRQYRAEREALVRARELAQHEGKGLFLATVSIGGADGYGIASDLIKKGLEQLDIPVARYFNEQKISLIFHAPQAIASVETPYRIIYTMFESTKIPDTWLPYLKEADLILVPTKWGKEVFAKSGIETKVVNLGYNDDVFKYYEREDGETFTFLHYNAFNVKKGFMELFKAFTEEFDPKEPVRLVLKTIDNRPSFPILKSQYPNIDVIKAKYNDLELYNLLKEADCFVFPSRGEGFGLTPLEAMATGLPTIVPNAHGISEYFDKRYMYEVKASSKCPGIYKRYQNQDVGEMVVCDVKHLRKQMRWVYENRQKAKVVGKKASRYVKKYSYKKTAKKLKDIYLEYLEKPIEKRQINDVLTLEKV